jgi:hypothetical protein
MKRYSNRALAPPFGRERYWNCLQVVAISNFSRFRAVRHFADSFLVSSLGYYSPGVALERRPACPLTRSCARNCCRFAARVRGVLIVSCRFLTVARVLACFAGASCSVSFTRYSCTSHARSMRDVTQQCENARETSRETSATAQVRNAAATRSEASSNASSTNGRPKARGTPRK